MPEGPEVRRCAEQLADLILGKRVFEIRAIDGKLLRKHGRYLCNFAGDGPIIESVRTKGKAIFITFGDQVLISTLGMSGWWYPKLHPAWWKDHKAYVKGKLVGVVDVVKSALTFAKLELVVEDQVAVFTDMRNFGNINLVSHEQAKAYEANIGLDLLSEVLDDDSLEIALERLKRTVPAGALIGGTLLDQAVLSGLGNIYRAETLYIARVNPFKLVKDLTDDELERIIWAAVNVLNIAYHTRGTMLYPETFLSSMLSRSIDKAISGHLVYGREADVFGYKVVRDKSNGRTMWWVPQVQG